MTCRVLQFIHDELYKALHRGEMAEVTRRENEESKHLATCPICAATYSPLYLQLWSNAKIGVDTYVTTNQ